MRGITIRSNSICFGRFDLQALKLASTTSRQIEARRQAIIRYACRGGKIWIHIFPNKHITMRPTKTHMGSRKGSPKYWVFVVKPNKILYEISGIPETIAKATIQNAYTYSICYCYIRYKYE
jgi:large subunit ribosomal protein L16